MTTDTLPALVPRSATVPANRLAQSPKNARKTGKRRNIPELAASILALGLLQNLVVTREDDLYLVDAGERRRLAIALLIEQGKLPEDWPVLVQIVDSALRTAASSSENVQRQEMHPADQLESFADLTSEGWSIDRIADAFGVTPLVVERRLRLARAAPALLDLLRADEITTEQLTALCASDDHQHQVSVWDNSPSWNRTPGYLRRAVLADEVDAADDARVAFIGGAAAFAAAGGEIRRDLFSAEGDGGFIRDIPLLTRLVTEKLEAAAEGVRAEGWAWVEIWPEWMHSEFFRLGRIHPALAVPPDAAATLDALWDERDALQAEMDAMGEASGDDDLSEADSERLDAAYARMEEIEAEAAAIEQAHTVFDPAAMQGAGAVVGIERGTLRIERGLVRAEDRPGLVDSGGARVAVSGGRETQAAGRKASELSDALARSLLGHRNLAVQTETAANPRAAKILLACWIVQTLRHKQSSVPVDLRISETGFGTRTQHPITDEGGAVKRKAFDQLGADLTSALPKGDPELWDTLAALPDADLDRLIAFAAASAVSVTREPTGLSARLVSALGVDMADHFTPTAANYFGRVSKALIVDAMAEAGKATDDGQRSGLLALKKADLAARAERDLAGTRWVPGLIRTHRSPAAPAVIAPEPLPAPAATRPPSADGPGAPALDGGKTAGARKSSRAGGLPKKQAAGTKGPAAKAGIAPPPARAAKAKPAQEAATARRRTRTAPPGAEREGAATPRADRIAA